MKRLTGLALFVFLFNACTKEYRETENNGIIGKWKLTAQYVSIGGPGTWEPYTSSDMIIQFTGDGKFIYSPSFPKASLQFNRYSFDGNSLAMSSASNNNTDTWPVHSLTPNKLDISVYTCFEGCAYRFTAVE